MNLSVTGSGTLAVIKNPPHPNASKLFINWLLSREGQKLTRKRWANRRDGWMSILERAVRRATGERIHDR